jgi:hypothetical protein
LLDPDADPELHLKGGYGSRRAKITHKEKNKEISCYAVLCWGLKASPLAWVSFMEA